MGGCDQNGSLNFVVGGGGVELALDKDRGRGLFITVINLGFMAPRS
jgi:hypothetical protein